MLKSFALLAALVGASIALLAFCNAGKVSERPAGAPTPSSFFQFTVNSLDGEPVSMEQFKGKKIVVLNVASKCGYTPQYGDWEKFYEANKDKVVVLGFPCNDFGSQEPGSAGDIAEFCQKNYGVTFPMFEKVHVKGAEKAPLYQWLTDPAQNGWNSQEPGWNFCKYVINEKGELTHFFGSNIKPDSAEFLEAM
ncbi:MAG: glutathione peroxidase [Saprospiraceae bacterium]|nr:glutathione peroxidase [Saprospiraceae bacterium]